MALKKNIKEVHAGNEHLNENIKLLTEKEPTATTTKNQQQQNRSIKCKAQRICGLHNMTRVDLKHWPGLVAKMLVS